MSMPRKSFAARLEALERLERAPVAALPVRVLMTMHASDWQRWCDDPDDAVIVQRYGIDRLVPGQRVEWCVHVFDDGAERWFSNCDLDWRGEPARIYEPSTKSAEQWQGVAAFVVLVDNRNRGAAISSWAVLDSGELVGATLG